MTRRAATIFFLIHIAFNRVVHSALADQNDAGSLQNLHDIVLPAPVPWWPPAPGWYVVVFFFAAAVVWALTIRHRRHVARRYRQWALTELEALRQTVRNQGPRPPALRALPVLLKRTALAAWPRRKIAALNGRDWWRFLDINNDPKNGEKLFENSYGRMLDTLAYQKEIQLSDEEIDRLFSAVGQWIQNHRTPN